MYYVALETPMMSSVIADCPDLTPPNILDKSTPMVSRLLRLALVSWATARVDVHRLSLRLPYLGVIPFTLHLPLDFIRVFPLRPTYLHPFGRPFTYSLFKCVQLYIAIFRGKPNESDSVIVTSISLVRQKSFHQCEAARHKMKGPTCN